MVTSQISRVYLGSVYTDGVCESVCDRGSHFLRHPALRFSFCTMEQVICWCNDLHIYQHLLTLTDLLSLVGPHTLYACLFVCLPV